MNISIIIPNYNGEELLKKNLPKVIEAIKEYKNGKSELIIADDASSDGSINIIDKIQQNNPNLELKVLKSTKNSGFSSNVNKAVKESIGEVVILLNTDVYPEANFLGHLMPHFKDSEIFAVGCLEKSIEEEGTILRGRGIGKWAKGFLVHSRGNVDKTDTLWASGGSAAYNKSLWEKMGGLNNLYNPFYWEDIDISYRAQKSGYQTIFEKKSIVYHEHSKGSIKTYYKNREIKTVAYRNQFIFVWLNITDPQYVFLHIIWLPFHFVKALLRIDKQFFIGFFRALILSPEIIRSRLRNNRLFVKRDKDLI